MTEPYACLFSCSLCRTKWKRQTAVGLELLAEAGNYAAFQRLYGNPTYLGWPYNAAAAAAAGTSPSGGLSVTDIYYRQAAAAAALQKPLPYRMYPGMSPLNGLPPGANSSFTHLPASNSLSSLGNYYQPSSGSTGATEKRSSPSPPLDPGSPETASKSPNPDVDDETIQV